LLALETLKAELKERGWFDRRRALPRFPRVIGVVTSRDGAALQDFLRTRSQRWPLYPVRLAHTPVARRGSGGGDRARDRAPGRERRRRDRRLPRRRLARGPVGLQRAGGGRGHPPASVPVVSGVGHETDTTLADLVADHRAHTPTDAAQTVLPDREALLVALERAAGHLGRPSTPRCASASCGWRALVVRGRCASRSGCSRIGTRTLTRRGAILRAPHATTG
jgi:exodeoxyribonuclease VII large subunit